MKSIEFDRIVRELASAVGQRRQLVRGKAEQADSAGSHVQAAARLPALPADQGARGQRAKQRSMCAHAILFIGIS
eukprot:3004991-Pleurochrysis_carterae.AAC.1